MCTVVNYVLLSDSPLPPSLFPVHIKGIDGLTLDTDEDKGHIIHHLPCPILRRNSDKRLVLQRCVLTNSLRENIDNDPAPG